ncbi:MAG: glycosyltransferase [Chloroflexi bacterium]|nr:glycosyltransferase [Chloroflexota bacterium]
MKVAFDGRTIADRYPGIGRYAFGLARALAAYTEVTVISNPAEENSRHDLSQISAHRLPLLARPGSLDQHRFIPAAVGATDASVYHAPYFLLYPSPTFMPLPCPSVVTFYDLIPLSSAAGFSFMGRWMIRFSHRQAGEDAARIIVLSRAARDSFVAKLSLDSRKIVIIPPGIDSHFRPRLRNEVKALRARIGLPDRYLLYVGS